MFTINVQVIRNTAHRPSTQASYTIGSGTTLQENQPAAQIAAKHNIFSRMAPYMLWIFLVLVGIDPGVSHLGGEIASHNTTDARQLSVLMLDCLYFVNSESYRRWSITMKTTMMIITRTTTMLCRRRWRWHESQYQWIPTHLQTASRSIPGPDIPVIFASGATQT